MNGDPRLLGASERPRPALLALLLLPIGAGIAVRHAQGWVIMATIAATEYAALKLATLHGLWRVAPLPRVAAFLFLCPGLNARAFLQGPSERALGFGRPIWWPCVNLLLGLTGLSWAIWHANDTPPMAVGWVGMVGIIFLLHFGTFSLLSNFWCRMGVAAPPIMRAPIASTSVAEFWGRRWNIAFADCARRFIFKPLARTRGAAGAGAAVFLISGLVHETVISLPAHGGWGWPTVYFVAQALGIQFERTTAGRRLGLAHGLRGWAWTFLVVAAPLPLLFHPPFVTRVIVPLLQSLRTLLP